MANTTVGTIDFIAKIDTSNYKKGASDIEKANSDIEKSTNQADKSTSSFGSSVGNLAKGALRVGAVALAGIGVAALVMGKNFVESASELQSLRASFESLTGSSGSASRVMAQLYEFGKTTAFTNNQIQTTARSFLAAGVSVEQLGQYMAQAGDIAGATGADLAQFALPLTQAIARGKLQTQDFYQILNSGAGAFRKNLEEEVVKRGLGNLQDALAEGTVTTEVLTSALANATKVGGFAFQGAIKQAQTYNGRLSNMQEAITNIGLALLGVDAVTGEVKVGGFFDTMSQSVQRFTDFIGENKQKFLDFVETVIKPIGEGFLFIRTAVLFAVEAFKPLTDYVTQNARVMEVLRTTLTAVGYILGIVIYGAIGSVIIIATALTATIEILLTVFTFLIEAGINVGNALGQIFEGLNRDVTKMSGYFTTAFNNIVAVFSILPFFFSKMWETLVKGFTNVGVAIANGIGSAFKGVMNGIISFVENTINNIINSINAVTKGIDDALPGDQSGFRVPRVGFPRLAEGGIVSSATVAMIGEGKEPEAVIPLSKLDDMLSRSSSTSGGDTYNISVEGAYITSKQQRREFAEAIMNSIKQVQASKAIGAPQ